MVLYVDASLPKKGEACTGACEEGTYCGFDLNTGMPTVCLAKRGAGADCTDDFDSRADGLDCRYSDIDGTGTCTERLKAGEICDNGACADGLDCYMLDGERRCRTLPDEGEACDQSGNYPACGRIDNACDGGVGVKLPGAGESCQTNYTCVPSAECYDNGSGPLCYARGGLGEPCGVDADYRSCLGNLQCGESNRCVEPEPDPVCEVPG